MRFWLTLFLGMLLWPSMAQEPISNRDRDIVFVGVNVIPMDQERVLTSQTVTVRNGRITAIQPTNPALRRNPAALYIEATGKYLVPGWAEMHAHIPPIDELAPMKDVLMLYLVNGITTIRGMLGHPRHLELRSLVNSGAVLGPHVYTTGPSFNGQTVKTPERGAAMVREQKAAGYDFLKLHPGLTNQTFPAIAKAAQEAGIPFVGHVSFNVGVWRAIDARYSSIDHLDGFVEALTPGVDTLAEPETGLFGAWIADRADVSRIPKLMAALRGTGIHVVPTQALAERWLSAQPAEAYSNAPEMRYMKPGEVTSWVNAKNSYLSSPGFAKAKADRLLQVRRQLIVACQKNNVPLLLGSDAPQVFNVPGFSIHHEMQYLVDAGLSPYETLRSGTVNVATYLKQPDRGTIKVGNAADLVLLRANPLANIANTRQIDGVMMGTNWLPKTYIDQTLSQLIRQ